MIDLIKYTYAALTEGLELIRKWIKSKLLVCDVKVAIIIEIIRHGLFKIPKDVEVWKESTRTLSATHQVYVCTTAYSGYGKEKRKGKFALTQYNQETVRQTRRKLLERLRMCRKLLCTLMIITALKVRWFHPPSHLFMHMLIQE